jgi:two-component system response regulator VicR
VSGSAERTTHRSGRVGGRALVVENDEDYAVLASTLLRRDGWIVELEPSGQAALQRLRADAFNVVLVDTALATLGNGRSLLAEIRGASDAPLIALSRNDDRDDLVEQAVQSADYDLVKPFSPRRFRAAVRAVTRRGRVGTPAPQLPAEVRVGDVTMSFGRLEVVAGDRRVELSPREFALLHLLLAHPGTVFTREELARLAWGWRGNTDSRAVDNAVRRLRQKIEPDPRQPRYIVTERGAGYYFAAS